MRNAEQVLPNGTEKHISQAGKKNQVRGLKILTAGVNSQLQDVGRKGYGFTGVSQSGFLDARAAYLANRLCGNPISLPLVEIPWGGFRFVSQVNNVMAVCGADVEVKINNTAVGCWRTLPLKPNDEVLISPPKRGIWVYLAIRGGFQVKPVLGSVSGNQREKMGGLNGDGQALKSGDLLPCLDSQHKQYMAVTANKMSLFQQDELSLRIIPGGQYSQLTREQKRALFNTVFTLSTEYNRMGYRLQSDNTELRDLPKITPDAIAYGAVQVPPSGQPIVLLNDRQTLGGYCKVGSVISPDCHRLVQCRPGCKIHFRLIRPTCAQNVVKTYWSTLMSQPLINLNSG